MPNRVYQLQVGIFTIMRKWFVIQKSVRKPPQYAEDALEISKSVKICQDVPLPKGFDMKNRPKPRIRPVDYHWECCVKARFRK